MKVVWTYVWLVAFLSPPFLGFSFLLSFGFYLFVHLGVGVLGSHLTRLRDYSWLCAQAWTLMVQGTIGGIWTRVLDDMATHKVSALTPILTLQLLEFYFFILSSPFLRGGTHLAVIISVSAWGNHMRYQGSTPSQPCTCKNPTHSTISPALF